MGVPQLDRYEVIEELGQGGMSVVYRARDRQLNRDVAVKVLHDFLARQEDARRRFHREAVAVAKLHHPGIVEIFDYSGPDADQSYIVCELIQGRTLRTLIDDEGPIPHPELAALVTAELTRALRHAHEQGIIHRDLKPENVMVTDDGRLKLMDFGIAQIMGVATRLTATGTLLGSPAHMAPEMIDGLPSDHRGDIFSVGTVLYWLATGELPFAAPNPTALFRQILEGEYEPAQAIQPRLGNGLSRIIDRALALDPSDRYQDISELQDELQAELNAVDLLPVEATARAFLARPMPFADELRPNLVARLADAGKQALDDGNVGRATDRFNRVLAIDPDHTEVLALVRKVGRRRALAARLRRGAVALATLAVLAGVALGVFGSWPGTPASARLRPSETAVRMASPAPVVDRTPGPAVPAAATTGATVAVVATRPSSDVRATGPESTGTTVKPQARLTRRRRTSGARSAKDRKAEARAKAQRAARRIAPAAPPDAGVMTAAPPDAGVATAPRTEERFPLLLRMHPGWADVFLDGRKVAEGRLSRAASPDRRPSHHSHQKPVRNAPRTRDRSRAGWSDGRNPARWPGAGRQRGAPRLHAGANHDRARPMTAALN